MLNILVVMPLVHCQWRWLFKKYFLHVFFNIYVTMWQIRFKLNVFENIGEIQIIRGIIKKEAISSSTMTYKELKRFNVSNASLSWHFWIFSMLFGINLSNHNLWFNDQKQYAPHILVRWCYKVKAIISVVASVYIFFIFILVWQIQDREVWKTAIPKRTKRFGESRWLGQVR